MRKITIVTAMLIILTMASMAHEKHPYGQVRSPRNDLSVAELPLNFNNEMSRITIKPIKGYLKTEAQKTEKLDSLHFYMLDEDMQPGKLAWREFYNYNLNHLPIEETSYFFDGHSNEMVGYNKYGYEYDAKNRLSDETIFKWSQSINDWIPHRKTIWDFDSMDNPVELTWYEWQESNTDWGKIMRAENSFNEKGFITASHTFSRNTYDNQWVEGPITEYSYTENDMELKIILHNKDINGDGIKDSIVTDFLYNEHQLLITKLQTGYYGSFHGMQKTEYDYDEDQNLILQSYWLYSNMDEEWVMEPYYYNYHYDNEGFLVKENYFSETYSIEITFDIYGNQTSLTELNRDDDSQDYIPEKKNVLHFDYETPSQSLILPLKPFYSESGDSGNEISFSFKITGITFNSWDNDKNDWKEEMTGILYYTHPDSVDCSQPLLLSAITGLDEVCQGQKGVVFEVDLNEAADNYIWTLSQGVTGASTTNSITVDFDANATSNQIMVQGENLCGPGQASVLNIVVKENPPKPIITMSETNILQSDATVGNQWYADNVLIPGATLQQYIATQNGDYSIMVTMDGCSSEMSEIVTVIMAHISHESAGSTLKVYPNPASNMLMIEFPNPNNYGSIINLYDVTGKKAMPQTQTNSGRFEIDVSSLQQGVYFIEVKGEKLRRMKLVVE
jgi:hypothetical protein